MDKSDERLQELMKALADTIGHVLSGNKEIKQALAMIEKEGYHVDLILASITRITRKDERQVHETEIGVSDFDRSFLRKIRIKLDEE